MPTTYPRIQVTVTPEVAEALASAKHQWPRAAKSELVANLIAMAHDSLDAERATRQAERRRAIAQTSGILVDAFPDGYLADLRSDWPA